MTITPEMRYQVPDVVREMQDGLSHLNCYRVCPLHSDGNVEVAQHLWNDAAAKIQAGINWFVSAPEMQVAVIAELKSKIADQDKLISGELAKAKATAQKASNQVADLKEQVATQRARADNLERLSRDLQTANLTRPEVTDIANRTCMLMAGLRYVGYLQDDGDINRQLVCGMRLLCQQVLRDCGAEAEVSLSTETVTRILTEYYATVPQREIDAMKAFAIFHSELPDRKLVS